MRWLPIRTGRTIRTLRRHAAFTITTVATLALALTAIAALVSLIDSVLLRPLPYREADRLVWVDHAAPGIGSQRGLDMTAGLYLHYREQARAVEHLTIHQRLDVNVSGQGTPERLDGVSTTHALAAALGVPPLIGRFLDETDDAVPGNAAVVLSHGLWTRRFAADRGVLGRAIELDGVSFQIVGVMPRGFGYPVADAALWIPLRIDPVRTNLGSFSYQGVARLVAGRTVEQAQRELERLIARLSERFPDAATERLVREARLAPLVSPLKHHVVADVARTLWILMGTAGLILLVAGANVLNLFLVRAESRRREAATRLALGAGNGDLLRASLAESAVIATLAGALAIPLTAIALVLLRVSGPVSLPRRDEIALTPGGVIAACLIAGLTAIVLGLAARPRRVVLAATLREAARGLTTSRRRLRLRHSLVAGQVALSTLLAIAAALLVRSSWRLSHVDPGIAPASVLTFQVGLPRAGYDSRERAAAAHNEILDRIRRLPGVVSAGAATCLPLCGSWAGDAWRAEGRALASGENPPVVATRRVTPGYLETLRVRLIQGRTLTQADEEQRTGAAVISAQLARRLWPDEDPLGRRLYSGTPGPGTPWYTVVGVVGNTPIRDLTENPAPTIYLPLLHVDSTRGPAPWLLSFVVRTTIPPRALLDGVRRAVRAVDSALPVARVRELEEIVSEAGARLAFVMALLVVAAATALALGMVGIYGVLAYTVAQRAGEFGVRMALGARRIHVAGLVLRSGAAVVAIGLAAGVTTALWATRLLAALLYGVSPTDGHTFAAVSVLIACVALAAALLPAWSAARADPATVLRAE